MSSKSKRKQRDVSMHKAVSIAMTIFVWAWMSCFNPTQEFFDELNGEFHFTLDPAANEANHKCETFFTKEQNGLTCQWGGHTVFCNPPYGREIGKWVQKAWEEHKTNGNTVVMLLPAQTDTRWFHEFIYGKAEIRFVRGRLKFGNATNSAQFPSMVVVWRGD